MRAVGRLVVFAEALKRCIVRATGMLAHTVAPITHAMRRDGNMLNHDFLPEGFI